MLDPRTQRRQRAHNLVQSTLLLGCLLAVAAGLAWLLLGMIGLLWTLAVGGLVLLLRPRIAPRMVLAMFRARPLSYHAVPELYWMLDELTLRAHLHHRPALYYVPSPVPNCFCLGHGRGAVLGLTDGLLRRLTRREIARVLGHELGPLRARDTTVMSLIDVISRLVQGLAFV